MNTPTILTQPNELLIKQILYLNSNEISQLKLVNKHFYKFIKNNQSYISKKHLEEKYGEWISDPYVLFHCMKYNLNIQDFQKQHCFKNTLRQIIFSNLEITTFIFSKIFKINSIDRYGNSILMSLLSNIYTQSTDKKIIEKIKIILNKNPNVKIENQLKQSAIIYACTFCRDVEIIKKIVQLGGNVYERDIYGWNAIMYAIMYNSNEVVSYLNSISAITFSDVIEIVLFKKDQFIYINSNFEYNLNMNEVENEFTDNFSDTTMIEIDEGIEMEDYFQTNFRFVPSINTKEQITKYCRNFNKKTSNELPVYSSHDSDILSWVERSFYLMNIEEVQSNKIHLIIKIYNSLLINFHTLFKNNKEYFINLLQYLYILYQKNQIIEDKIYKSTWNTWISYTYYMLYYNIYNIINQNKIEK